MPRPVVENITRDVLATLKTVKRSNGYHQDLDAERGNAELGNRSRDVLAIVTQEESEEETDAPQQYQQFNQIYAIELFVSESESSETTIEDRLNNACHDVIKALTYERASQARDGWAIDTKFRAIDQELVPGAKQGTATVRVAVQYRILRNNPFASPFRS
jgi:hypothetical protein